MIFHSNKRSEGREISAHTSSNRSVGECVIPFKSVGGVDTNPIARKEFMVLLLLLLLLHLCLQSK